MGRQPAAAINQQGFTLLELIATLLVMALAVALAAPTIGRSTETIRMRAEVARFSAILRHAPAVQRGDRSGGAPGGHHDG
jgi:prepilin-type N-terminal cleavage/methylation domain-containing protein